MAFCNVYRGLANGGGKEDRGAIPLPHPSIYEPKKVQQFQFQTSGLWVFRNYMKQKLHDFYRVCYNFWAICGGFSFFSNYRRGIDHFTLDLLKRSDTSRWTY